MVKTENQTPETRKTESIEMNQMIQIIEPWSKQRYVFISRTQTRRNEQVPTAFIFDLQGRTEREQTLQKNNLKKNSTIWNPKRQFRPKKKRQIFGNSKTISNTGH